DLHDLENLLSTSSTKTLVTLMHANNEIGNMIDLHEVGNICQKYNAIFHSDTVQTVGHFPFALNEAPVHFITGSAHKFHGPKGVGILYINQDVKITPYMHGGGQERNMRAGTENIYGIVGFAKALEIASEQYEQERKHISELKGYMLGQLKEKIKDLIIHGDPEGRSLYTVLNIGVPKSSRTETLLMNLDIHNICASGGSACTSGAEIGSHVIRGIGGNADVVPIRFSFSKYNTKEELDIVINKLLELVN
ncbi:MAG: cysteine desulfurase family protein, partial [Bacteroidota bacterium]